ESGKAERAPEVSRDGLAWAKAAAERVARRLRIARIDAATLARWRADETRTLHLFDVRDPREYAAGHVAGALSAPEDAAWERRRRGARNQAAPPHPQGHRPDKLPASREQEKVHRARRGLFF